MKRAVIALATAIPVLAAGLIAGSATPGLAAESCGEAMQRFTAQWNVTTPGHKTADSQRAYAAAQKAQKAGNERDCVALLRKAADALQ